MSLDEETDFGFERVRGPDKARKVADVFASVASRYDVMNDLMSLGLHRLWKRFAVDRCLLRSGDRVLDVAGGSGDLAAALADRVGPQGEVWLTDINPAMLAVGRDRLANRGLLLPTAQCDAERLPFPDGYFDCVTVGFGLRNMTHKDRALAEMTRVLRPGGRLLVLEFSRVWEPLAPAYDQYSFNVLPWLGKRIAGDPDSYRYLAESIRMHPDQATLVTMMEQCGLDDVQYWNLAAGIVAVHRGIRYS
jgi:demethylmenaquinone methyltransferase/2-methoxy-6-polyprenyl-1,4-benzoquinol methylase